MNVEFRQAGHDDRDAILALRRVAFPHEDVEKQSPAYWDWEFRHGYAGAARIFVAMERDTIVGHFAFVPQHYRLGTDEIRGALACDVMTHPDYRQRGVFRNLAAFAVDKLKHDFQVVTAFQIRRAVASGMFANGWREQDGLRVLLRPASVRALLRGSAAQGNALDTRRFTPADAETLAATVQPPARVIHQPRSSAFLRWRFAAPGIVYHTVARGEDAWIVYRKATLRGYTTLCIVDAAGNAAALRSLLRELVMLARREGLQLVATLLSSSHPARRALIPAGLLPGPHRFAFLLQTFDPALRALERTPWTLSWGDTDHL